MIETFDECLLELGNPGRFRIFLYVLLLFNMCLVSVNFILIYFAGFVPNHHCKLPLNSTWSLNESIPLVEVKGHATLDQCSLWVDPSNTSLGTTDCLYGWEYELEEGEWFVSTQFDLVCHRRYMLNMGLSVQYTGITLGGIIFGFLSDRFGRRKSVIAAVLGHCFFSILLFFANSAIYYFSCAFFLGIFIQGIHSCSYTLSAELFHPQHRTIQGVLIGLPWSLSFPITAAIFWAVGKWSYAQLFPTILSVIGVIYVWFIPESLRWHLARGNVDEIWEIAEKFARFNKMKLRSSLREEFVKLSAKMVDQTKSSSELFKDLFRSAKLRRYAFILAFS